MTLEQALRVVEQLSPTDKLRLIEKIVPTIAQSLPGSTSQPRRSLLGLCADLGQAPSEADIDAVRQEMWAGFGDIDV
jgi:hypothetical protein